MRPSTVSIRSSIAPGAQHPPSAENLAGLNQKKKEAEAVDALQRASALFLQRLEGLGDDCEAMADAGAVLGEVLAQWPQMFRILNLFQGLATYAEGAGMEETDADPSSLPPGERLVRVPIDELQQAEQK
ncbi:hypothetical protein EDB84DRAFT_1266247 [Lactarius hengduanensis]|nr:hypothetical protein EDB84DRAFT_1266247 [Lactarius hengduanensis]